MCDKKEQLACIGGDVQGNLELQPPEKTVKIMLEHMRF
jgi:hypothetical protein